MRGIFKTKRSLAFEVLNIAQNMAFQMGDNSIYINKPAHVLIDLKKRVFRLNKTNGVDISPNIVIHSWLKMPREHKKHPRFFL